MQPYQRRSTVRYNAEQCSLNGKTAQIIGSPCGAQRSMPTSMPLQCNQSPNTSDTTQGAEHTHLCDDVACNELPEPGGLKEAVKGLARQVCHVAVVQSWSLHCGLWCWCSQVQWMLADGRCVLMRPRSAARLDDATRPPCSAHSQGSLVYHILLLQIKLLQHLCVFLLCGHLPWNWQTIPCGSTRSPHTGSADQEVCLWMARFDAVQSSGQHK